MKNVGVFLVLFLGFVSLVSATPPRDMQLKFNYQSQMLNIQVKHPTAELRENYIRTITVTINAQESQIYRFPFQRSASEFETSIPLALKAGDTIVIKATCSQGGSTSAELRIPAEEHKDEK